MQNVISVIGPNGLKRLDDIEVAFATSGFVILKLQSLTSTRSGNNRQSHHVDAHRFAYKLLLTVFSYISPESHPSLLHRQPNCLSRPLASSSSSQYSLWQRKCPHLFSASSAPSRPPRASPSTPKHQLKSQQDLKNALLPRDASGVSSIYFANILRARVS